MLYDIVTSLYDDLLQGPDTSPVSLQELKREVLILRNTEGVPNAGKRIRQSGRKLARLLVRWEQAGQSKTPLMSKLESVIHWCSLSGQ